MLSLKGEWREPVAGKLHPVITPADLIILGDAQGMRTTSCDWSTVQPAV
jgi:hypothetical protein